MKWRLPRRGPATFAVAGVALVLSLAVAPSAGAARPREYWIAIAEHGFAVPEGAQPFDLLVEMNDLLASTDPVLRDQVAYSAVVQWVYKKRLLSPEQERRLVELWSANLTLGIGERGTDSVLRRSFSALDLSMLAALDNEAPFLGQPDFDRLLGTALDYLHAERDTRGYDPSKGWMHAAGHAADLLKFLARSPRLAVADQRRLLDAVAQKCSAFGEAFVWGEDERLAQVVRSIARRADLDRASFEAWLAAFPEQHQKLWAAAPAIEVDRYVAVQNVQGMLRAAHTALAMDGDLTAGAEAARTSLLETLRKMR